MQSPFPPESRTTGDLYITQETSKIIISSEQGILVGSSAPPHALSAATKPLVKHAQSYLFLFGWFTLHTKQRQTKDMKYWSTYKD